MKKGIYLCAGYAYHPNYNLVYNDLAVKRDIQDDCLSIDLSKYDFILASPPCNFWSRARGNRVSKYSLLTKHLLPDLIDKLISLGKPFIVENVKNIKRFYEEGILPRADCFYFTIGRHIYFTNVLFDYHNVEQRQDFKYGGKVIKYDDMINTYHQGGFNVHQVFEEFLRAVNGL